jgi:hypothetical protein
MTTSVPRPGQLHDEVYVYPAAVSAALAVLAAGGPNLFTLEPTHAELAAVRAGAPLTDLLAPPSPEVTRRIGYYMRQWLAGQLEDGWMFATAYRWPARDREHAGPAAAECGWTDYVDAAAVRRITRGEAA